MAKVCGLEGHMCGGLDCVKTLAEQHKRLTIFFGNIVMKTETERELIADCHAVNEEYLLSLEQKH